MNYRRKVKTVYWSYYLYNENIYTWKDGLYIDKEVLVVLLQNGASWDLWDGSVAVLLRHTSLDFMNFIFYRFISNNLTSDQLHVFLSVIWYLFFLYFRSIFRNIKKHI